MRRAPPNSGWSPTVFRCWERSSMSGIFEANRATGITPITPIETPARRCFERIVALAALALAAPVCVAIAVAVRGEDGGPVLFRQRRVGRGGEPFELLKFRSMSVGAAGAAVTAAGDGRVTRTGRWLRKFK